MKRASMAVVIIGVGWPEPEPVGAAKSGDTIEQSVVKVITVVADPSYQQPWQAGPQGMQSGSAWPLQTALS